MKMQKDGKTIIINPKLKERYLKLGYTEKVTKPANSDAPKPNTPNESGK